MSDITSEDADRLLGLADQFLEDWREEFDANESTDERITVREREWAAIRPLLVQAPAFLKALEAIAATPLWGEPIADPNVRAEYARNGEYDREENEFNPSGDTESTLLRDAVEEARAAIAAFASPEEGGS